MKTNLINWAQSEQTRDTPLYIDSVRDLLIADLAKKYEKALIQSLIAGMAFLGVDAREDNVEEWAPRLTKVKVGPDMYEYYLDYDKEAEIQKGYLLTVKEKVNISLSDDGKITATIGG